MYCKSNGDMSDDVTSHVTKIRLGVVVGDQEKL